MPIKYLLCRLIYVVCVPIVVGIGSSFIKNCLLDLEGPTVFSPDHRGCHNANDLICIHMLYVSPAVRNPFLPCLVGSQYESGDSRKQMPCDVPLWKTA